MEFIILKVSSNQNNFIFLWFYTVIPYANVISQILRFPFRNRLSISKFWPWPLEIVRSVKSVGHICCKYVYEEREWEREKAVLKEGVTHIPSQTCTTVNFLNSPFILRWLWRQVQPPLPIKWLDFLINTRYWHNSHKIFMCSISN